VSRLERAVIPVSMIGHDAPAITVFSGAAAPTIGAAVAFIDYRGTATMSGAPVQNGDVRVVRVGR